MSLSNNIRTLRKKAGLTQVELAESMDISIATLRRWEGGETAPSGTKILDLAKQLKVSPKDIITDDSEKNQKLSSHGMLVFEDGNFRIELPPTPEGYQLFNQVLKNSMASKQR